MGPRDVKVDPDKLWLRAPAVWLLLVIAVGGALGYARFDNAVAILQETVARNAKAHAEDRAAIVESIKEVRDELRKLVVDMVATRQAQAWIELFRSANRSKFPELVVPDLPR